MKHVPTQASWLMAGMATLIFAGCNVAGDVGNVPTKIQYMPDMADSPTTKAHESYIEPPEHAVPINGVLYPDTVEEAQQVFKNPFPASDANIAKGKALYNTFCIPCHGADAKGKGSLGPQAPVPPDITHANYQKMNDGFFFYRITFGKGMMPGYGHSTNPGERWQIVHYLRTLQKGQG